MRLIIPVTSQSYEATQREHHPDNSPAILKSCWFKCLLPMQNVDCRHFVAIACCHGHPPLITLLLSHSQCRCRRPIRSLFLTSSFQLTLLQQDCCFSRRLHQISIARHKKLHPKTLLPASTTYKKLLLKARPEWLHHQPKTQRVSRRGIISRCPW